MQPRAHAGVPVNDDRSKGLATRPYFCTVDARGTGRPSIIIVLWPAHLLFLNVYFFPVVFSLVRTL